MNTWIKITYIHISFCLRLKIIIEYSLCIRDITSVMKIRLKSPVNSEAVEKMIEFYDWIIIKMDCKTHH